MYKELGESLPLLLDYSSLFQDKRFTHMHEVLKLVFLDILRFHQKAYNYFKKPCEYFSTALVPVG
jgi:hypothetical protein